MTESPGHKALILHAIGIAEECGYKKCNARALKELHIDPIIPDALLSRKDKIPRKGGRVDHVNDTIRIEVVKTCDKNTSIEHPGIRLVVLKVDDYKELTLEQCWEKLREEFE